MSLPANRNIACEKWLASPSDVIWSWKCAAGVFPGAIALQDRPCPSGGLEGLRVSGPDQSLRDMLY